jgi:pyrimidine deaminase RibD-like protein
MAHVGPEQWMKLALSVSRAALPACRPNPPVGCVIVRGEAVVARGFTGPPGQPHAEAAALLALPRELAPAELTLFVTLEPCSFMGRTPSCALALIASGIRRVVVATLDPHPRNQGRGIQLMRDAGLSVELGTLEADVLEFISPYLIRSPA